MKEVARGARSCFVPSFKKKSFHGFVWTTLAVSKRLDVGQRVIGVQWSPVLLFCITVSRADGNSVADRGREGQALLAGREYSVTDGGSC